MSTIAIPNFVLTILSTRNNAIVARRPVDLEYKSFMCFPLELLLLVGTQGLEANGLIKTIEDGITLGTPGDWVDRLVRLDQVGSEITIFRPDFNSTILTRSGECSSIITPFDCDDGLLMGISHVLIKFAVFVIKFETSITKSDGHKVAGTFRASYPIMIDCKSVKVHPLGSLVGVGVPFVHGIILADTEIEGIDTWLVHWRSTKRWRCRIHRAWFVLLRVWF